MQEPCSTSGGGSGGSGATGQQQAAAEDASEPSRMDVAGLQVRAAAVCFCVRHRHCCQYA